MNDVFTPDTVAFCCLYAVYNFVEDLEGLKKAGFPEGVRIKQLSCCGRIDPVQLLEALEAGADGVYIVGCKEDACHNVAGSHRAKKRADYVKRVLTQLGMEPQRVDAFVIADGDQARFIEIAKEMVAKVKALGASPLRGR